MKLTKFDPEKFDKPDEAVPDKPNLFRSFPKDALPRDYYLYDDPVWFSETPESIARDLGFDIERGKLNNLLSFADGEIDFWYFLCLLPPEHRKGPIADEWVNFILGPLAATAKVRGLGFDKRQYLIDVSGIFVWFEAMALGLVPPGKRKALYEAILERYNAEFFSVVSQDIPSEEAAKATFYGILADVVEPIFAEAGANELLDMVTKVLDANPQQAATAKADPKVIGWIMGQVMKASPTKLDPNTVRAAITEKLATI